MWYKASKEGEKVITEFAIAGTLVYGYNRFKSRELYKIKNVLKDIIGQYEILKIEENKQRYEVVVSLYGEGFEKLNDSKKLLEDSLGYNVEIEQNLNLKTATIYVIKEKLTDDYPFIPVQVKPYELYLGKTYTMKDIITSMRELPHMLFTGINSSGKTYCMVTALANLIYWNDETKIELYLAQISAKKDLRKFKDVRQCRGYADKPQEAYEMLSYLFHIMQKRISIFNNVKNQFIDDIYEWNKAFPKRQMRIIYLAMDEFAAYIPDTLDSPEDAECKGKCLEILVKLIQQCRCTGIYIITSLQRADKESLPPRLKAQFNCRVSFKQPNIASSLVVTDSDKAFLLKPKREAIVSADDEYLIKTLYTNNKVIQSMLKDNIDMSHKNYYNYKKVIEPQQNKIEAPKNKRKKSKSKVKIKCT